MKLYGAAFSPYVQRCLMVARAKGREIPLLPPPPDGNWRSPEYRAINPLAKVPCLDDGGFILPESGPIADYLDAVLPGQPLWPVDPRARARAAFVTRMVDIEIGPGVSALLGRVFFDLGNEETRSHAIGRVRRGLRAIAHFRENGDVWMQGDGFSHADAALMPMLATLDHFGEGGIIEGEAGLTTYWTHARASDAGLRLVSDMAAAFTAFLSAARRDRI